ncbi:cytochrome c oxidase assembly protein [Sphingobium sp. SCG-1]|uniref:cytochrome c oxidase assembly protein n=1 Tax=Sphingobium sp. SCG-1 TaxID=2072936 RepID=UPI0016703458|nr:cytochrome c oxidase assembly protein [Sphingobium sp. SCG-1]
MRRLAIGAAMLGLPAAAAAHEGHAHAPIGWTFDATITVPLLLSIGLYVVGFVRLWPRAQRGHARMLREGLAFGSGWLVLTAALVSPLHQAGERSFTMHMIEHEVIMLIATLLLAVSRGGPVLLWGLPVRPRRGVARIIQAPAFSKGWRAISGLWPATILQATALWLWHAPLLFDLALRSEGWHVAQHLSFILTSLLFWWAVAQGERHGHEGLAALCLFVTATVGMALGALMALSLSPWYAGYAAMGLTPYGLTPEQDQQLAGLIMWIPGGVVHMGATLVLLYRWINRAEMSHALAAR